MTSTTDALNHTTTATYDFNTGLVTSITNAKGNTVSFEYDVLGRARKRINPDLTEKEVIYNDQNNVVTIYDELDHYVIQYYDGIGRLQRCEWYLSPSTYLVETYTHDYQGNVITRTDPGGHIYSCEYDSFGRPVKITNPDLTYGEVSYDDVTNTVVIRDENQHKKEYHLNWVQDLQWVKEYTDPVNYYLTQYTYDSVGNLTSVIDANSNTTRYSYDSLFGVTEVLYPDSTGETCSYDAVGNLLQRTNGNGTTLFTYNSVYQLTEILYPDQSSVSFQYDENGNCMSMTDSSGYTAYTYDDRNRLLSETRTINGVPYITQYTYDAVGNMQSIIYPDQSTITYEYDPLSRLTAIPGYCEFTYTADSLLDSVTYSNGTETLFQYDVCHRPVAIDTWKDDALLLSMGYQYDLVGNNTYLEYSMDQGLVESEETFQYDWLDRLAGAQGDYGVLSYSYDSVGNRLSQNGVTYTYNDMNELVSTSDGAVFTYDDNGNTITKTEGTDTWIYTYDARNLLTQVIKDQEVLAQFTYDGNGKRIQKTEWIDSLQEYQTIIYVYSGSHVIYEKNEDTDQEALYCYGPLGRIAKNVSGLRDYYHTDRLGSTRLLTDESGNIVAHVEYGPFGESMDEQERYLYTGKEKDSTGLYYYGARYYDPELGRFLTRDPLTGKTHSPQSLNRYTYCLNNPLKYVDPLGLSGKNAPPEGSRISCLSIFDSYTECDSAIRKFLSIRGKIEDSIDALVELLEHYIEGLLQKVLQNFLYTGTLDFDELYPLMSFLEAVVKIFGDVLGISGAFICIEGMGDLFWYAGAQGGVCLVYHPDLGWAYYTYAGRVCGLMFTAGASIIAGFWTWHIKERKFEFKDWEGSFEGTVGTGGISLLSGTIVKFNNPDSTITGWGVGVGVGVGYGIAGFSSMYERAENWMIPIYLWGIVVPKDE